MRALAIASLSFSLAACGVQPTESVILYNTGRALDRTADFFKALFSSDKADVEALELGRNQHCNSAGRESWITLLRGLDAVRGFEQARGITLTPATASLPEGLYAVVEVGQRNTGGYAFAVASRAARDADTLYIKGTYLAPKVRQQATQMLTAACSLVLLRTSDDFARAVVIDQSNQPRAEWRRDGAAIAYQYRAPNISPIADGALPAAAVVETLPPTANPALPAPTPSAVDTTQQTATPSAAADGASLAPVAPAPSEQ